MNIGLVIYGSLDDLSGGYIYDRKLVEYLRAAGHEVQIISLSWRSYSRHLGDNVSAGLLRRLAEAPFDLLLQDELNHPSLFWLNRRLKERVSYPLVTIVHHLFSKEDHRPGMGWIFREVERAYLHSVDGFVFNSATTRLTVECLLGRENPHVVAYPAGDRFEPLRSSLRSLRDSNPKIFSLLFVGNLIPRKGLHTLIRAVAAMPFRNVEVDVIGDLNVDPYYALDMMKLAAEKKLEDRIHFWGRLDDNALARRFTQNDVLVVPSAYEGFGIVYLEAMGFEMPVIGTRAGAAAEIIDSGRSGFLIEPGDEQTLTALLTRLYHDRPLREQMGQAALRRFEAHPTWHQSCQIIERFLVGLVEEG